MSEAGHTRKRIATRGVPADEAGAAAILIHGRGGSPEGMLTLADQISVEGLAWIAPRADGATWYPTSFLAPLEENEPWLSSALEWLDDLVAGLEEKGIPAESVGFVGFSQGACLSTEFVARHPRRYGGVAALSGGLVGPPGADFDARFDIGKPGNAEDTDAAERTDNADHAQHTDNAEHTGNPVNTENTGKTENPVNIENTGNLGGPLSGTPIFLGCSDVDPHIPEERVHESGRVLDALGGRVTVRIYPGMGHTVNDDEIDRVRALLQGLS